MDRRAQRGVKLGDEIRAKLEDLGFEVMTSCVNELDISGREVIPEYWRTFPAVFAILNGAPLFMGGYEFLAEMISSGELRKRVSEVKSA